ncbi:pyridoxamine 5'-phosphate oxidase family protein [Asticcacaulis sp. SL142]|uniref:pyridoxamine 5'-phosphate oxidase family protein n=1 Tax=Asticcacaulis sp. SL142 TaxID=2995155 RepID=UPI00226CC077|nr:pyridoxamine 5'-phosphate oxidase family protein [Asticcacaulis sp. SL142]WAC49827.1 pyridoxamine 5'-phosphate oxidase family protein [Asticcacaulis sp. SL142]
MTEKDITEKFWKALRSDRTIMLGLRNVAPRPMTALVDGDEGGPIWIFTSKDTELAKALTPDETARFTFADKGHNVFATVYGALSPHNDRAVIERLWNPFIAAWFTGKDDPKLQLLRFDAREAEIWVDASSLMAGLKLLLGSDPKEDFKDKVAKVEL